MPTIAWLGRRQVHFYHSRGAISPLALHALPMGCVGHVMVQKFRCKLLGNNSIWVLKHFGGGRTIVDSSCAMSVVPFSGDGDPLEDRSFMPYANAFAETSRFKDVPRIIHIYIYVLFFFSSNFLNKLDLENLCFLASLAI